MGGGAFAQGVATSGDVWCGGCQARYQLGLDKLRMAGRLVAALLLCEPSGLRPREHDMILESFTAVGLHLASDFEVQPSIRTMYRACVLHAEPTLIPTDVVRWSHTLSRALANSSCDVQRFWFSPQGCCLS